MVGDGDAFVAGGVESMSRAPWAVAKPAKGYATGPSTMYDTSLGWRFVNPRMEALGHTDALGVTAENLVAEQPEVITRAKQDEFALASHRKALAAQAADRFADELVPVTVKERKGERVVVEDEGPRADSSLETLAKLEARVREGRVAAPSPPATRARSTTAPPRW